MGSGVRSIACRPLAVRRGALAVDGGAQSVRGGAHPDQLELLGEGCVGPGDGAFQRGRSLVPASGRLVACRRGGVTLGGGAGPRAPRPGPRTVRGETVDAGRLPLGPCPIPGIPPRRVGVTGCVLVGDGLLLVGGALIARRVVLIALRGRLVRVRGGLVGVGRGLVGVRRGPLRVDRPLLGLASDRSVIEACLSRCAPSRLSERRTRHDDDADPRDDQCIAPWKPSPAFASPQGSALPQGSTLEDVKQLLGHAARSS